MKILVVWYDYFHYLSSITSALKKNGNIDAKKFTLHYFNKQAKPYEKALTALGICNYEKAYYSKVKEDFKAECIDYKPDLVLFLNADYRQIVDKEVLEFLGTQAINTAIWFVDSISNICGLDEEYLRNFDNIYSFEYADVAYIKEHFHIADAKYLPLGAADEIYKRLDKQTKKYDICFVGSNDKKRLETLENIAKYCVENSRQMVVYGHIWKQSPIWTSLKHEYKFKNKYPNLHKFVINKYLTPTEVAELYSESKICLNIVRAAHKGANPRTFEILATKSFQLLDYNSNIEMLFENKKHLVMYKDEVELISLIDYYLKNYKEREQIAQNGYELVSENYTLNKLVIRIVDDVSANESNLRGVMA